MALKQYNPTSPGRRFMTTLDFSDLTSKKPERALTEHPDRFAGSIDIDPNDITGAVRIWTGEQGRWARVLNPRMIVLPDKIVEPGEKTLLLLGLRLHPVADVQKRGGNEGAVAEETSKENWKSEVLKMIAASSQPRARS